MRAEPAVLLLHSALVLPRRLLGAVHRVDVLPAGVNSSVRGERSTPCVIVHRHVVSEVRRRDVIERSGHHDFTLGLLAVDVIVLIVVTFAVVRMRLVIEASRALCRDLRVRRERFGAVGEVSGVDGVDGLLAGRVRCVGVGVARVLPVVRVVGQLTARLRRQPLVVEAHAVRTPRRRVLSRAKRTAQTR